MKERIVIAVLLLFICVSAAQQTSNDQKSPRSTESNAIIQIEVAPDVHGELHPTAEIVLVDPQERKTGLDNNGQTGRDKPWQEIPTSSYIEVPVDNTRQFKRVITVRNPVEGGYWLGVYGTSDAVYRLTVTLNSGKRTVLQSSYRVRLNALSVDTYLLHYSRGRLSVHSDRGPVGE